jgi:HK97 family phage prohead protease
VSKLEQRAFELSGVELRADDSGQQKMSGYFIEWGKRSNPIMGFFVEQFQRGAFRNLSGDIRALWQHDSKMVLGRTTNGTLKLSEDDVGVRFEILPDPEISWHRDALRSVQRGDVTQMSFMFRGMKDAWDDQSDPDYPIRTVLEAELYEVSPVTFPAYPQTNVGVRSAQEIFETYTKSSKTAPQTDSKSIELRRKRLDLLSKF